MKENRPRTAPLDTNAPARAWTLRPQPVLSCEPMKCPHCNTGIHEAFAVSTIVTAPIVINLANHAIAPGLIWILNHQRCPECHDSIILLGRQTIGGAWTDWKPLKFMA